MIYGPVQVIAAVREDVALARVAMKVTEQEELVGSNVLTHQPF